MRREKIYYELLISMIPLNKNLLIFLFSTLGIGISILAILAKFVPLFFDHTVYYCQLSAGLFSIKFPHKISLAIIGFLGIIFTITLLRLMWLIVNVHLLKRELTKSNAKEFPLNSLVKRYKLKNKVYVIENNKMFAFCLGIINPEIYFSTNLLSLLTEREIEAVLLHEKYHLDHRDSLTMIIAVVLQQLFPFFPLFSDLIRNYKIEREIEADHQAIQILGEAQPISAVLKKLLHIPAITISTASAIADHETLLPRIKAIIGEDYSYIRFSKPKMFISFFVVAIIIGMLVAPVHATEIHGHKQDVTMVCLQGEGCVKQCAAKNDIQQYSANYSTDKASYQYSMMTQ